MSWIPLLVFASVGTTVYFVLIPWAQNRRQQRRWSTDGGGGVDIGTSSGSNDSSWNFGDWFSSSSTDSSGSPTDSGGDSGGGGDGGGGGGD
jgi:hypothetical protein